MPADREPDFEFEKEVIRVLREWLACARERPIVGSDLAALTGAIERLEKKYSE